jgi:tetratricopeptide (TPR) repeat protein
VAVTESSLTLAESFRLAEQYLDDGDPQSAVRLLEPLVSADAEAPKGIPSRLAARLLLARAYFHSADLDRAEEQFRRVLDLDPADHFAHFALGRTLERQGRPVEALRHYRIAAAMTPSLEYEAAVTRLGSVF